MISLSTGEVVLSTTQKLKQSTRALSKSLTSSGDLFFFFKASWPFTGTLCQIFGFSKPYIPFTIISALALRDSKSAGFSEVGT